MVQSVPGELSMDQTVILQKAEGNGGQVSVSFLRKNLEWEEDRSNRALDRLLSDGLAWVDTQNSEKLYWIPSIFSALWGYLLFLFCHMGHSYGHKFEIEIKNCIKKVVTSVIILKGRIEIIENRWCAFYLWMCEACIKELEKYSFNLKKFLKSRFDSSVVQPMGWQLKSCYLKENSLNQVLSN